MSDFDLDAARAARREASGEPLRFTFGGQRFEVPSSRSDWPFEVSGLLQVNDYSAALEVLLGEQWPAFKACRPTFADLVDLLEWLSKEMGFGDLPGSSASGGSSTSGSESSRPTSTASTGLTSSTSTAAA